MGSKREPNCIFVWIKARRYAPRASMLCLLACCCAMLMTVFPQRPRRRVSGPVSDWDKALLPGNSTPISFPQLRQAILQAETQSHTMRMLRALAPNMQTATCLSDVDLSDEMRYTLHTYAAWHQTARNHLAAGSEHIKTLRFRCLPESGGLGDQLKGLLLTFLLALTAERQRAFFIDCSYNVPLETVWLPCLGLTSSIDWRWDPRWPLVVNNIAHDTRVEYFGMAFDEIAARTSLSWAAGHRTTEMYFEHFRVLDSFSSIVKVAQPLLGSDTIHIAFTTNLMRHEVFNLDGRGTILWCSKARCKTPSELQLLWGNGPVGSNRMKWAFSLLDYLFRPSPALLQTLCNQIGAECYSDGLCVLLPDSVYSKHRPYLVGVHARMGGSSGTFVDPQRAPPETVTLLASCAQHVVDHMIKVQGPRAGIVWFLCSDANQWLIELRIAAARAGVQVAEFSSSDLILHVDKTAVGEVGQQAAKAGFIKAYGEHFILSAVHAIVKTESGFSLSAAAWGRVPIVWQPEVGSCVDISALDVQSR